MGRMLRQAFVTGGQTTEVRGPQRGTGERSTARA